MEKAVIAAILIDKEAMLDVADILLFNN